MLASFYGGTVTLWMVTPQLDVPNNLCSAFGSWTSTGTQGIVTLLQLDLSHAIVPEHRSRTMFGVNHGAAEVENAF